MPATLLPAPARLRHLFDWYATGTLTGGLRRRISRAEPFAQLVGRDAGLVPLADDLTRSPITIDWGRREVRSASRTSTVAAA